VLGFKFRESKIVPQGHMTAPSEKVEEGDEEFEKVI
tara:strand:- start:809 stop:916 length:108 start_codon:yes stop_codon:yes gene_type:complete